MTARTAGRQIQFVLTELLTLNLQDFPFSFLAFWHQPAGALNADQKSILMFKNYLKVALRNLWKNKAFSAINILGLSAGLAVCLLIVLYVKDELSYDRYNAQAENIYRLDADISFNGTQFMSSISPAPLAPTLKKDFPGIIQYARLRDFRDIL